MASEKGPVATEGPPPLPASTISPPSIPPAQVSVEALQADATRATASLKRAREATPVSPSSILAAQFNSDLSPPKVARLIGLTSRHSPAPLTGAAALADLAEEQRRRNEEYKLQVAGASENPAYKVQSELMSAGALALSRPQDAPMSTDSHSAASQSADITAAEVAELAARVDVSPQSATSMASLGSIPAPVTESPGPMEVDSRNDRVAYAPQPQAIMEEKGSSTSLSYPGILSAAAAMPAPPARGMSLPMTPNPQGPRSPNSKKHKCPYCETEFTRHHNLKSHLLTHSQEKPYICQSCQMRFRRLHDLKRHSKLHTGEKPHECPKCQRKFARGDALARHAKGPGGCVTRRGSLGFGDDDFEGSSQLDGDDSVMSGVGYDGTDGDITEEDRRLSLPSIKAPHVQGNQAAPESYASHSRTYPPGSTASRLYPPNMERAPASSNTSSATAAMYAQVAMTESPKPLSPSVGTDITRQRSPSLTTQFQQQHFGRHQTDRQTPPGSSTSPSYPEALVAQLLSVPGFAPDARFAASGQAAPQGSAPTSQAAPGGAGQPANAGGSGGATPQAPAGPGQNGGSGDSTTNNIFATDQGIWAYIHSLEESIRDLGGRVQILEQTERTQSEKIVLLTNEITTLREHVVERSDGPEVIS